MRHVNLVHDIDMVRRGTQTLVIGSLWAAFAAVAAAATIYDIGLWLGIW